MAKDKKTAIIYTSWIHAVEVLTDEEAGKLMKHLLRFLNDQNPEPENRMVAVVFEPMKQQLKSDLKKYEATIEKKKTSGTLGGLRSGEVRRSKRSTTKHMLQKRSTTKHNEHGIDNVFTNVNNISSSNACVSEFEKPGNKLELFKKITTGTEWWQVAQKNYQATEDELLQYAKDFFFENEATAWPDESAMKKHFIQSFKLYKQNERTQTSISRTGASPGQLSRKGADTGAPTPGKFATTPFITRPAGNHPPDAD